MRCLAKSKAEKAYQRRIAQTMTAYVVLIFATTYIVRHNHLTGWLLYVLAVLPSFPILLLIYIVALYLREETDEFLRMQTAIAILWGAGAVLAVSAFTDFLRSYTQHGTLPPFTIFMVFWAVFALTQFVQWNRNGTGDDDEQA